MSQYDHLATNRTNSIFAADYENALHSIKERLQGASLAVIGAAGSIGKAVVLELVKFNIRKLILIDQDENGLVEVVRTIRSSEQSHSFIVESIPLNLGSEEFQCYCDTSDPFDYILNLSAMKHVRSEKNIYTLSKMFRNNAVYPFEFINKYTHRKSLKRYFSVSSDKAVNPANFMGASKRCMELLMAWGMEVDVSSARFANVAFSSGSLLDGFNYRLKHGQPLAGPSDITRFFISSIEAAQMCLIAAFVLQPGRVLIPNVAGKISENNFKDIAERYLEYQGLSPVYFEDPKDAIANLAVLRSKKQWPCVFLPSNTSGEKPYEEFIGPAEIPEPDNMADLASVAIMSQKYSDDDIVGLLGFYTSSACLNSSKLKHYNVVKRIVPEFKHIETNINLDSKM